MSELKTKPTNKDVKVFISSVEDELKKESSYDLLEIFSDATGEDPVMWGTSIIGYGKYHYKSERSRQEGDWMITGFSPRKQNLTIYIMNGFEKYADLLKKLGKHKTSVSCLYIKKLDDVDSSILKQIITKSYKYMNAKYK